MSFTTALEIATEMLIQRGYKSTDDPHLFLNKDEKVRLLTCEMEKMNISTFQNLLSSVEDTRHVIIIYKTSLTPQVPVTIKMMMNYKIELFKVNELQMNITKHFLVPNVRKVEALGRFLEKSKSSLPVMLMDDPITRFYNYQLGDIIQVQTNDTIYYRRVDQE